jgi:putative membrane protein
MKTIPLIASGIALMLAAACGHEEQPAKTATDTTSTTMESSQPSSLPPPAMAQTAPMTANPSGLPSSADVPREGPAAGSTEAQPTMQLTDGQILEIIHAANVGEIDQAKLALSRTADPHVKSLAQMMVRDHTQAAQKGMVIAKKANIERQASPLSQSLESAAESATGTLKAEPKADFDKNYVDTQVREHQDVLDSIDQKLMVNVSSPDLKAYLVEVRAAVASHLQHARDLLSQL